jgi:hypothetical protein
VDPTRDETSSGTAKEEMRLQIKRGRRSKEKTRTLRFFASIFLYQTMNRTEDLVTIRKTLF